MHSDVVTEAILPLEKGILTGRDKTDQRGKIAPVFALGTRRFFEIMDRNPLFSFQPIDAVCHPVHHRGPAQDGVGDANVRGST